VKTAHIASAAALALSTLLAPDAAEAQARNQIRIVGSSTVFPYTQAVAERFANETGNPAPVVESTGTGGGMQIFCDGIGEQYPDITGASRAMKASEYERCQQNGVDSVTEVQIGSDGLSFATSREGADLDLTKGQLFKALAAQVPNEQGQIVDNPYRNWSDIDPSLPDQPILVYGPPPTSGTRDAWVELVMEAGCEEFEAITQLPEDQRDQVCQRMRTDGVFVEAGENDNLIIQRLDQDPNAFGIFGYSFLYENEDRLKGAAIEGVEPSYETIESGEYPVSRPLFFYVKNAHRGVIPGLQEFVAEYVSEEAIGEDGYLTERGLIPLAEERAEEVRQNAVEGVAMEAPAS
jgi:phosphate transport system substrate-binding protein